MSLGDERELVPLGAGFSVVRKGYSVVEVNEHLERLDADLKMLTQDRDAAISQAGDLARQLEMARNEIDDLRGKVERLSLPPTSIEGLSEQLQKYVRMAQEEADETRARAEAEAAHIRAKAEADSTAMRTRYDQMLGDLDARRQEMEREHRQLMDSARAEAKEITNKAQEERLRKDLEAEERRTKVDEDFEIAMAGRRSESMRQLAEQEATSKAEAEKRVGEATKHAAGIREQIAKELAAHKTDVEQRYQESVEDANRRKHESITEAEARIAEATDEAHRRVREATDLANRRINQAADRVEALRALRADIAEQIKAARTVLADADGLLVESEAATARRNGQQQAPKSAADQEAETVNGSASAQEAKASA